MGGGTGTLTAQTVYGVLRGEKSCDHSRCYCTVHTGLETFSQLVYHNTLGEVRDSIMSNSQSLIIIPYSTPSIRLILMMLLGSSSVVP